MLILIHSSKTMRPPVSSSLGDREPQFLSDADKLATALKLLSIQEIAQTMSISLKLATSTQELIASWTYDSACQRPAIDSFLGDIYSGLQVAKWTQEDRTYANDHLRILSGLYGLLRPLDGVYPYRFEMGYKLPAVAPNMYAYWGRKLADAIPQNETIINLAAVEYSRAITGFIDASRVVTPRFLTVSPKTGEPVFVVVHAKIARGAFASWLVTRRVSSTDQLHEFTEIGYEYNAALSTEEIPVFICHEFGGLGLSVRLA